MKILFFAEAVTPQLPQYLPHSAALAAEHSVMVVAAFGDEKPVKSLGGIRLELLDGDENASSCPLCAAEALAAAYRETGADCIVSLSGPFTDIAVAVAAVRADIPFIPGIASLAADGTISRDIYRGVIREEYPAGLRCALTFGTGRLPDALPPAGEAEITRRMLPACAHGAASVPLKKTTEKNPFAKAKAVLSAGEFLEERKRFERSIIPLARKISAVPATTSDAAARGVWSREQSVGARTHFCSPRLYIALGAEGTMEHLTAIRGAEFVIAVDDDPESQLRLRADAFFAADPSKVMHRLDEKISRLLKL